MSDIQAAFWIGLLRAAIASVTLTDTPMTRNGYAEARLVVEIPETIVLPYEWITEMRGYRRFSIPASVINAHARVYKSEE